jgi:hypothetical protein
LPLNVRCFPWTEICEKMNRHGSSLRRRILVTFFLPFSPFLADHFYEMICYCSHRVCPSVCPCVLIVSCDHTVLDSNIRFGAKDASFIQTSGTKDPIWKFNHLPPYFGGEMGRGYGKCGKKRTKVRLSRPLRQIMMFCLHLCVAPT